MISKYFNSSVRLTRSLMNGQGIEILKCVNDIDQHRGPQSNVEEILSIKLYSAFPSRIITFIDCFMQGPLCAEYYWNIIIRIVQAYTEDILMTSVIGEIRCLNYTSTSNSFFGTIKVILHGAFMLQP